ncbi:ABC transporter substrate-binding protein [Trueperella sp. LYQ143]|uniref:ABC transporter substrate-binding protein n=1 Tax=Trueperella sp. LYQ143 TaxID=3391059 RepID=UPI003982F4FC
MAKKFRSQLVATGAIAGITLLGLTACSDSGSSEGGSGGSEGSGNLVMWTRAPLESQGKHAVEAYNATHDKKIQLEILPNDDVEGKVGAAVQTDSLPCLLAGDVVRIPYWTEQGIFTDLTDRIDGLENVKDLQAGHIAAGTIDGKKHTLPFVTDISVMVWNKNLYKEAGLDPEKGPTTMDEFVQQAQAIAKLNKEGVSGSYLAGQSGGALVFTLFPTIWGSGAEVLSEDGSKALLDSPESAELLKAYRTLAETPNGLGAGSREETGATWTAPFQEGKVGVMPYPFTTATGLFANKDFEIGVAPIPGLKGGQSTFLGGDAIGITSSCKDVDGAWDFMAWLMTEDAQKEVFVKNNDTAGNIKVLESAYGSADPRTIIANGVVKDGRTPVARNFNEAFNAPGSPWQLLIQNAVWGDAGALKADNEAITKILGQ